MVQEPTERASCRRCIRLGRIVTGSLDWNASLYSRLECCTIDK
jgi:hypothetical protein